MEDEMTSNTTLQIWNGAINALVQTVIGLTLLSRYACEGFLGDVRSRFGVRFSELFCLFPHCIH
jgi:hypothetical protein